MSKRTKFSIIVMVVFFISIIAPSFSYAETPDPPFKVERVDPIFQTVSVSETSEPIINGGPVTSFGQNWIVNGNAELATTFWTGGTDDFIMSVAYGTADMPTLSDPGPTARGTNFFKSSGTKFEKNAWQTWSIDPARFGVNTGKARFTLSGYLGGKGTSNDRALLRVYFGYRSSPDNNCAASQSATIGPVTASDRGNQTGLFFRTTSGIIPTGINCLSFQLQMYVQPGTEGNAYADNLSFVIDGIPLYLPMISQAASQPSDTIPAAPTNLVISETNLTSLRLSWKDNSNNETGFVIQRAVGTSPTYTEIARVGANITTYLNSNLTQGTTYKYRVGAYNTKGTSTFAEVTGVTLTPSKTLTINNLASYPIVSMEIGGFEQFPVYPMGLMPGYYYQIDLDPGTYSFSAITGFWQNELSRFEMYVYSGNFTMPSSGGYTIDIEDIPIEQLLTQFQPSGYWEGWYMDTNAWCHTAAFRFFDDGTYEFYDGGVYKGWDYYTLTQRLPETYSVKFSIGAYEGWLFETYGYFDMKNGPPNWQQINYVYKPQGYIEDPMCP